MYILCTYMYENPVLVHTKYILFICFRTDTYQYILGMYWYEHFRRVSSRVSGFQMILALKEQFDAADIDGGGSLDLNEVRTAPNPVCADMLIAFMFAVY